MIGYHYIFRYPRGYTTLPEYTAHANKTVRVRRQLIQDVECETEGDPPMLEVECLEDGWIGQAWEDELEPFA